MELFSTFRQNILDLIATLQSEGVFERDLITDKITAEPPRDPSHGDISTNVAMVLSKQVKMAPRAVAEKLLEGLKKNPEVSEVSIAGPGFINLFLHKEVWVQNLKEILTAGPSYGNLTVGQGKKVNVEFVSVNPTGPMHVGHSRGAIMGDVQAALFQKAGYDVVREYYVNDAGSQIKALARAVHSRYLEALGRGSQEMGDYPGDYLIPTGKALADRDGDKWADVEESVWMEAVQAFSIEAMMDLIRADLDDLGIHHDVFSSEKALVEKGKVEEALDFLTSEGLIYEGVLAPPKGKQVDDWEPRPQTLFRSTQFGDDVDRALKKSDGGWTYFASDIAYHLDKYRRGFEILVNVWGADHGGYVKRLDAAVQAITQEKAQFKVHLCAMVKFLENGQPFKMSKRAGTFISIKDVVEKVGRDAVRFMMMTRKSDAPLDFDFAQVIEQSKDNPIFYVQYAHARGCSIERHIQEMFPDLSLEGDSLAQSDFSVLEEEDLALIKVLASWPRQILIAAQAQEPHRLAFYLNDVAAAFHGLWSKGKEKSELRFVDPDHKELTRARFALVQAVKNVITSGLDIFGIQPVQEMR
ncbi:MAG: arginine--tRNA ligase [bacterium]|nr:arginine--tRNA ligase [bacterium]